MSSYLKPAEVADILGCSAESVRRAIKRGDLRAFVDGRLVRISRADLDAYIARHTTGATRLRRSA